MKISIEIYPKEIKKLLELLDLIEKKPEYIYKNSSSKVKEPVSVRKPETKESTDSAVVRKISDMPYESVKYNKKEPIPNKELEKILNNSFINSGKCTIDKDKFDEFVKSIKQECEEKYNTND